MCTVHLVQTHMAHHYNLIANAKATVDNKPPKSLQQCLKAQNQKRAENRHKSGKRSESVSKTQRPHTATDYHPKDIYHDDQWGDPADEEDRLIHNIMHKTLHNIENIQDPYGMQGLASTGCQQYSGVSRQRPSTALSHRSMQSPVSQPIVPTQVKTYDGDIMEKRSYAFTKPKPFIPRTLKTDRKSLLSQYRCYNRVINTDITKQQQEKLPQEQTSAHNKEAQVLTIPPKPRWQITKYTDQNRDRPVSTMNSLTLETLEESNHHIVPKLDITIDEDHMKWLREQAIKAKIMTCSDDMKSFVHMQDPYDNSVDFGKSEDMLITYRMLGSAKTRSFRMSSQKLLQVDEEAKYVKFMKDVTDEILDRGIYTNRSLRHVFSNHIQRNKGKLDELHMCRITDKIRHELNIPKYDIESDTAGVSSTLATEFESYQTGYNERSSTYLNKNRNHVDLKSEMAGKLETSLKSKASQIGIEPFVDCDDLHLSGDKVFCSTLRSDIDNTHFSNILTLTKYQASINVNGKCEKGDITLSSLHSSHHDQQQVHIKHEKHTEDNSSHDVKYNNSEDDFGDINDDDHHQEPKLSISYRTEEENDF